MFQIKKLDIFIAKQFGMLFMGTFFISLFVLMMQFLWRYVDDLIGKGLSMDVLGQFFWYMSFDDGATGTSFGNSSFIAYFLW